MWRGLIIGSLLVGASLAHADVYKCTTAGKIMYQDQPCTEASAEPLLTTAPGLTPPPSRVPAPRTTRPVPPPSTEPTDTFTADECMTLNDVKTQLSDITRYAVEVNWKVDVSNRCKRAFHVVVHYGLYDKRGYEIARDREDLTVPSRDIGTATGRLFVRPASKMLQYGESRTRITFQAGD